MNGEMAELCLDNGTLNQEIVRLNGDCALLGQEIEKREQVIGESAEILAEKDALLAEKGARIEEILNSLPKWRRKKFL